MTQNALEITPVSDHSARKINVKVAGHFGELVQGRFGPDGPVVLVTLRRERLLNCVTYTPSSGPLVIDAEPQEMIREVATKMLAQFSGNDVGGTLVCERAVTPGHGTGSSTADLLGTIRAISSAFELQLSPEHEAALCLEVEGAVDPLMFDRPTIFASRGGRVLTWLDQLPEMQVIGVLADGPSSTDPTDTDFPDVSTLLDEFKVAVKDQDLSKIGEISTQSAELNQSRNPNPAWNQMREIADAVGAPGVVVAHTGSAIGIVLQPDASFRAAQEQVRALGYGDPLLL